MTKNNDHDRRSLVARIRAARKPHLNEEFFKVECKIRPCCGTCEFFSSSGTCFGGIDDDPKHAYGHKVVDDNDLCFVWSSSYDAWADAYAEYKKSQK